MTLTPYDAGDRLQPMPWHTQPLNLPDPEEADRYGKVDFDNDESSTVATLWIERGEDGSYTLKGYTNEPLKIDIDNEWEEK